MLEHLGGEEEPARANGEGEARRDGWRESDHSSKVRKSRWRGEKEAARVELEGLPFMRCE